MKYYKYYKPINLPEMKETLPVKLKPLAICLFLSRCILKSVVYPSYAFILPLHKMYVNT